MPNPQLDQLYEMTSLLIVVVGLIILGVAYFIR